MSNQLRLVRTIKNKNKLESIIQSEVSQKENTNTVYLHTHTHTHIYIYME